MWPASAAVVPTASSASVAASDRPARRHWSAARLPADLLPVVCNWVDVVDGRRSYDRPRLPTVADRRVVAVPRDAVVFTVHVDDDVTLVADVGNDRHVTQATQSTSGIHQGAL